MPPSTRRNGGHLPPVTNKTREANSLASKHSTRNLHLPKLIQKNHDRREFIRVQTPDGSQFQDNYYVHMESAPLLPKLRLLNASTTGMTDDDLKEIACSRALQKLILEDCKNLTDVSALSFVPTLEEIHLRGCSRVECVGELGNLPLLSLLDLSRTAVTADDLKGLCSTRSLTKLLLEGCKNLVTVNSLSSILSIEELCIRGCGKISTLGGLGLLPALKTLDVSELPINNTGLMGLGASRTLEKILLEDCKLLSNVDTLSSIYTLKEISLRGCVCLTNVGVLGSLPTLSTLDVSKTSLTDEGLGGLSESQSLERIRLDECNCLTNVDPLSYNITLKEVSLRGCICLTSVGVLGSLPTLSTLDVSKTSLTDEGLGGLSENQSLEKIILDQCNCLTNVSELSPIITLREIRLGGCSRVANVSSLGFLPELDLLDLSRTAVTSDSIRGLGRSPSLRKILLEDCWNLNSVQALSSILTLEEVYLRGCSRITHVGDLGKLPMLYLLDLSKTSVTDEGLEGLSASFTLKQIYLEDCKKLTTITPLSSIQTITEINVSGCLGVTTLVSLP